MNLSASRLKWLKRTWRLGPTITIQGVGGTRKAMEAGRKFVETHLPALEAAERKLISDVNLQRAQNIAFEDPIIADQFLTSKLCQLAFVDGHFCSVKG